MTNKEAIAIIKIAMAEVEWNYPMDYTVAFEKAIEALEAQDHKCENCDSMERLGNCVTWGIPVEPHMSCKLWEEKE